MSSGKQRPIKRIRVSVAVKCALRTLFTFTRTRRRHLYSDTLNRTAYTIASHSGLRTIINRLFPANPGIAYKW